MNIPVVKRIAQWDWQGKLVSDPVMCAAEATDGKPMNGGKCKFVARFTVDNEPMCVRHAQVHVFRRIAAWPTGNTDP